MSRRILALFAKTPQPGQVKTRLCPPLSSVQAAELYEAMLLDILDQHAGVRVDLALWFTPEEGRGWFERNVPASYRLIGQSGAVLGERMRGVFQHHASEGYDSMVLRGTDSPTLPPERIDEAFEALERSDLVLGPELDGGYTLIGLRAPCDPLFALGTSTPTLVDDTLRAADTAGLRTTLLPSHHDVDTVEDLARLCAETLARQAPRTLRSLARLRGWWRVRDNLPT